MNASPAILATTLCGALVFGFVVALVGSLRNAWRDRLALSPEKAEALWASFHWNLIPLVLLGGLLTDWWDFPFSLMLGSGLTALSLWLLMTTTTYNGARSTLVLASGGVALLGTGVIIAMPAAFFGHQEASASLNIGSVFLVLGALLASRLSDVLLRLTSYRTTLVISGLLALVPALTSIALPEGRATSPSVDAPRALDVISNPLVLAAAGVFFLYAPLEGAVSKWTWNYLRSVHVEESGIRKLETGFWVCFLASRLFVAWLLHHRGLRSYGVWWDPWILLTCAGMLCITLCNLAGIVEKLKAGLGVLLLGLLFGPVFPTLIGMVLTGCENNSIPDLPGTAFGTVFLIGSLGAVIFVPLFDKDAAHGSSQKSLRIPIGLSIALMIVTLTFALLINA